MEVLFQKNFLELNFKGFMCAWLFCCLLLNAELSSNSSLSISHIYDFPLSFIRTLFFKNFVQFSQGCFPFLGLFSMLSINPLCNTHFYDVTSPYLSPILSSYAALFLCSVIFLSTPDSYRPLFHCVLWIHTKLLGHNSQLFIPHFSDMC